MRVAATDRGLVFTGDLAAGMVAYVDGGTPCARGVVEAVVVEAGGEHDQPGSALGALIAPLLDALAPVDGAIEVIGDGAVALALRESVVRSTGGAPPGTIVDLTGDPDNIREATTRLADLGLLLLARDPVTPLDLDLYPDVHVRGLELVGVRRPAGAAGPVGVPPGVGAPAAAVLGTPAAPAAAWYRVSAGGV